MFEEFVIGLDHVGMHVTSDDLFHSINHPIVNFALLAERTGLSSTQDASPYVAFQAYGSSDMCSGPCFSNNACKRVVQLRFAIL